MPAIAMKAEEAPLTDDKGKTAEPVLAEGDDAPPTPQEEKAIASKLGWVPLKFFKGSKENWVDYDAYLERAHTEMPLLKRTNKKLEKQIGDMHALLKNVVASNQQQADRAVASALAKLKAEKSDAVLEGDPQKVAAIDDKIDKVKEEAATIARAPVQPQKPEVPEAYLEWVDDNPWFKESPRMRKFSEGVWDEIMEDAKLAKLPLEDQLKRVTKEVKAQFPDKFGNPRRREASAVEGGAGNGARNGGESGKSFSDLPPDTQKTCDDLIRLKVIKSRQAYLDTYRW